MGEFFKGWRRKAGCVALVMACVLMAGWVRSAFCCDTIGYDVFSCIGGLEHSQGLWSGWAIVSSVDANGTMTEDREEYGPFTHAELRDYFESRPISWGKYYPDGSVTYWRVPYWSIVIPLTLLSGYLLLVKPRPKKPTEST